MTQKVASNSIKKNILNFLPDDTDEVVGKDDRVRFVVAGLVGAPDRPETGERISLRRKTDFSVLNLTTDNVQVVL